MSTFLTSLALLFTLSTIGQSNEVFFKESNTFFHNYVKEGKVDYERVQEEGLTELNQLVQLIASKPYSREESKAYLINVYNLMVIKGLVDVYPVESPMKVPGFFDNRGVVLNGKNVSLNMIENDLLRKEFKDPRFHFVLVCGGLGCPPITNFAYTSNELESQMETQTRKALNDDGFVSQDTEKGEVQLSEIFDWYREDFGANNKEVLEYINRYRTPSFNTEFKVKYYPYDWTINNTAGVVIKKNEAVSVIPKTVNGEVNLQTFNAGSLLHKGQFDFTVFNTMYTQTKSNWLGVDYSGFRETFITSLIQVTYGVSKNKRFNLGFDISFRSTGKSSSEDFSTTSNAFLYTNTDSTRVGVTSVGVRAKFQPFKYSPEFTMQSTLSGPTIKSAEGNDELYWADWERLTWWNQLFYTYNFKNFQLFTELDFLFRFKIYENQYTSLDVPMSVFFSYFPTNKITFYVMGQHVPRMVYDTAPQEKTDWVTSANYTTAGIGFKYQVSRGLNFELLYTNFLRGVNSGLGSTFNLGVRYITK